MKNKKTRAIVLTLALSLVLVAVIGTALAWLVDKTEPITNTFTAGNVSIALTETNEDNEDITAGSFKMVPGEDIIKNAIVTVNGGSENSYVFVEIDETSNDTYAFDEYISYTVNSTYWKAVDGVAGVYYYYYVNEDSDKPLQILTDNKVTVKSTVTNDMMAKIDTDDLDDTAPTMTFTAYAIQSSTVSDEANTAADAATAWAALQNQLNPNP